LTANNLWADRSRNGLHASPQAGFAAPNFGLSRSARGKGYATFSGAANAYATLPLRFYDVAPTTNLTLVLAARHITPAINARLFNARTGVQGFHSYYSSTERGTILAYDGGGAASQVLDTTDVPFTSQTKVSIYTLAKTLSAGYVWQDGVGRTATWAGNTNAIAYNTALVPIIGSAGAAAYFVGWMYFLALFSSWIPNDREAKALSQYLRDWV